MFIDQKTPVEEIQNLLQAIGFFTNEKESITQVSIPGEGNMNVVLRITTDERSFILKQSRPFVQKYQSIDAPIERINVENQFYNTIANSDILNRHTPAVLKFDIDNHLLILDDLGHCKDMTYLYNENKFELGHLELLVKLAAEIHQSEVPKNYPKNKSLRLLNYQHIFELPFNEDNDFSLDEIQPGLQALSTQYSVDKLLKKKIKEVGNLYLSDGTTLIHGDYYPGSWMSKNDHIYIIDPEFSFLGFPEFDLGVLAAHAVMISKNSAILASIERHYPSEINSQLLADVTGIEIMRRLIGLAQLPISFSISEKDELLRLAYQLIMK